MYCVRFKLQGEGRTTDLILNQREAHNLAEYIRTGNKALYRPPWPENWGAADPHAEVVVDRSAHQVLVEARKERKKQTAGGDKPRRPQFKKQRRAISY